MKTLLHRYWFTFEEHGPGVGVTAFSREDAEALVRSCVFKDQQMPCVTAVIEDVDVQTLDQKHVVLNMGVVSIRGVWFPQI